MKPLPLALAIVASAPRGQSVPPEFAASRFLPADRTAICLELAGTHELARHLKHVPQLGIFGLERVRDFLTSMQDGSTGFARFLRRAPQLGRLLATFDVGFTAATILQPRRTGSPRVFLVAATRGAGPRDLQSRLREILEPEPANSRHPLATKELIVADSPIPARVFFADWKTPFDAVTWRHDAVYLATRGRLAAFHGTSQYYQDELPARYPAAWAAATGALVGLGTRATSGSRLGARPNLSDGERLLGRLALRWHQTAGRPENMTESRRRQLKRIGLWGFEGVQSLLIGDGATVRERIEIHHANTERPSFFEILGGGERGLRDAAQFLPADTLAAVRIGLRPVRLSRVARALPELATLPLDGVFRDLRSCLGLAPIDGEQDLRGLDEITLFLLPGTGTSLTPQLGLLLPGAPDGGASALQRIGVLLAGMTGTEVVPRVRAYGKAELGIRYVDLKRLLPSSWGGMIEWRVVLGLLGGGSVAASELGPYLAIGCNPKTLKRVKAAIRGGDVLAGTEGFLARFEQRGRVLEGFVDFRRMAPQLGVLELWLPWLAHSPSVRGARVARMPRPADLGAALTKEWFRAEATDFGHVIHLEGGTMLSPVAWTSVAYAYGWLETLTRLMR